VIATQRSWPLIRRRLVTLVAGVVLWLAPVAGSPPRFASAHPDSPIVTVPVATTGKPVSSNLHFSPTFRLGSAAQPFGWSTAVGDFNTDGTPDLVIADHTWRRAGVYAYQIQFSVSGLDARDFAFESAQEAITVRISDVDHDNDLDVVVNSAASREVVGIWLNDGRGHFESADVRRFASEIQLLRAVATTDPSVEPFTGGLRPRRAADGLPTLIHATPAISRHPLVTCRPSLQPLLHSPSVAPRGPPQHLA
jgi:hypothetical protein